MRFVIVGTYIYWKNIISMIIYSEYFFTILVEVTCVGMSVSKYLNISDDMLRR